MCNHDRRHFEYELPATAQDGLVTVPGECAKCGAVVTEMFVRDQTPDVGAVRAATEAVHAALRDDHGAVRGKCLPGATRLRDRLLERHTTPAAVRACECDGRRHYVALVPGRWVDGATTAVVADPTAGQFASLPPTLVRVGDHPYTPIDDLSVADRPERELGSWGQF